VITLDTSGSFALLDAKDPDHAAVAAALAADPGPYLVPAGILAEIAYLTEARLGTQVLDLWLADLESGAFLVDCGERDIRRIRELVERYADLPLGFADASVIACAERSGGRVLTLDRDFTIVSRDVAISIFP
jgi:predicted nucleic acid-binding protein